MSVRKETNRRGKSQIVCDRKWPDGKRFRRVMPNSAIAKQVDARIVAAIATGTWRELRQELEHGTHSGMTVAETIDRYIELYCKVRNRSWRRKVSSLNHVNRLLGKLRLRDVEMRHVHEFVAKRLKEEVKPATVNRDVAVLKHMIQFAVDEGLIRENRISRVKQLKEYREERPRVAGKTMKRILKYLPFPVNHIVTFIYETGCRPSEALSLKREHVDLKKQTAIFNLRKGGDNALVALTTRAADAIRRVPELPGCPYVFWNSKTCTRYQRINETFNRARQKAGCPHIQIKDFRRELGILIAESGQPLHVAQTQLGHSSIKTTEKYYAHFSPEFAVSRAREVMEQRWRNSGGQDPDPSPPENPSKRGSSNLVDFQAFKEMKRGGGRIRTAE